VQGCPRALLALGIFVDAWLNQKKCGSAAIVKGSEVRLWAHVRNIKEIELWTEKSGRIAVKPLIGRREKKRRVNLCGRKCNCVLFASASSK